MGTIVAVDSVVYNMAGEEKFRPQYLKSLVIRNVLSGTKNSIGDSLNSGYLHGPAIKLRSFYNWAAKPANYGLIGLPGGRLAGVGTIDGNQVAAHVPHTAGQEVAVQTCSYGEADPLYWARRWLLDNRPVDIDSSWVVDYSRTTKQFTITFPDNTKQIISSPDFDYVKKYIYVQYALVDLATDEIGPLKVFIYAIGSGNAALDALQGSSTNYGQFFPFIPFRLDSKFLSETYKPAEFAQVTKAYKKATGSKLSDLMIELKKNKSLGDIDHGYVVFGVSLNVLERSCRRYLYRFFEKLQASQIGGLNAYATWKTAVDANRNAIQTWIAWRDRQTKPIRHDSGMAGNDPMPPQPTLPYFGTNQIRIDNKGTLDTGYDIRLCWTAVSNGGATGLGRAGAKTGDIWLVDTGDDYVAELMIKFNSGIFGAVTNTTVNGGAARWRKFRIYWQRSANSYTWLEINGGVHLNYIYGDKAVVTSAQRALSSADESGFIVPLHNQTWLEASMVDSTQMSTACVFAVFNCYEVKKTKWYQSGIFAILLVLVIAIVSAVFTGGAGFGILGANLALGTSMGFTGMTAAIVGSVANAMAALLMVTVIEQLATGIFGPAIGSLISALLVMITLNVATAFQSGGALVFNWGDLLRVDNLLAMTDALGNGVAGMFQNETLNMQAQWNDFYKQAQNELKKIQEVYVNEFGYGGGYIDPMMFTSPSNTTKILNESSNTFLARTLMTGSEIAEMSRELLYNFPEYSLKLPDAFT